MQFRAKMGSDRVFTVIVLSLGLLIVAGCGRSTQSTPPQKQNRTALVPGASSHAQAPAPTPLDREVAAQDDHSDGVDHLQVAQASTAGAEDGISHAEPPVQTQENLAPAYAQPTTVTQGALASSDLITTPAPESPAPAADGQEKWQGNPRPHQKAAGLTFGPYYLHVGSFQNHTYAVERASILRKTGLVTEITHVEIKGKRWWRVLVPYLTDPQEASFLEAWIVSKYGFTTRVLRG